MVWWATSRLKFCAVLQKLRNEGNADNVIEVKFLLLRQALFRRSTPLNNKNFIGKSF
jgi:hypothetical protein